RRTRLNPIASRSTGVISKPSWKKLSETIARGASAAQGPSIPLNLLADLLTEKMNAWRAEVSGRGEGRRRSSRQTDAGDRSAISECPRRIGRVGGDDGDLLRQGGRLRASARARRTVGHS